MFHQPGQTETGPWFKDSSENKKPWGLGLASPGLVVQLVTYYTTAASWIKFIKTQYAHYVVMMYPCKIPPTGSRNILG